MLAVLFIGAGVSYLLLGNQEQKNSLTQTKYSTASDQLEPTDSLINGDCELIKNIAGNIKEWAGDWDAVWSNIMLRTKCKEYLVEQAELNKFDNLLEAEFVIQSNDQFHKAIDYVRSMDQDLDSNKIFTVWKSWFDKEITKMKMKQEQNTDS